MGYLSPPPSPAPVIVYKDVGGLVTDYEAQTEQYRRENREVRLHECRSACTLALSLPNVCVYPDAQVKFHQAYNALTREVDLGISAKLFASYPAAVQARLGYLTREYRILRGSELIALGVRNCNGDNPVLIANRRQREGAPTRIANAGPTVPGPAMNPFGDLARKVQTAVAGAFSASEQQPNASIRIAVADREHIPDGRPSSDAVARSEPATSVARGLADAPPLPPRRPPSEAFTAQDAAPIAMIPGSQPILSAKFLPVATR
ncbi:hypothetical protein [Methylocystis echinoides]|uniref:hypothetical protein n=1 Tax=Methylocystis echinoides TaxID=29468 RepID=UPI003449E473